MHEGVVVAVGPGKNHPETGVKLTLAAAVGDKVLYGKYDGVELSYDGATHQVIIFTMNIVSHISSNNICLFLSILIPSHPTPAYQG